MPNVTLNITANTEDGMCDGNAASWLVNGFGNRNYTSNFPEAMGFSFTHTTQNIPAGATITSAYLSLSTSSSDNSGTQTCNIAVEDSDPATAALWTVSPDHRPLNATAIGTVSTGSVAMANSANMFGAGETAPTNIASLIQSLVNSFAGILVGERINVWVQNTAGTGILAIQDFSTGAGPTYPQLFIEWTEGVVMPPPPMIVMP